MRKPIVYGILCEDKAHKNFIEHYLNQCYAEVFEESLPFSWAIKANNAREVEDAIPDATRKGFIRFKLDVLFIGRDADTSEEKRIVNLTTKLNLLCSSPLNVILMVPVQCIEHWLLYLQWRLENPALTKNESLEHIMRHEVKFRVYGGKIKVTKQLEKANELLSNLNVSWLESRSDSFKHFHNQVKTFLDTYSKTQPQ